MSSVCVFVCVCVCVCVCVSERGRERWRERGREREGERERERERESIHVPLSSCLKFSSCRNATLRQNKAFNPQVCFGHSDLSEE